MEQIFLQCMSDCQCSLTIVKILTQEIREIFRVTLIDE